MTRKTTLVFSFGLLCIALWGQPLHSEEKCDRIVTQFNMGTQGGFPEDWEIRSSSDEKKAKKWKLYTIQNDETGPFMRADYQQKAITLHKEVKDWDLKTHPYIEWKWRAHTLPTDGHEGESSRNDAAASIYVIWKSSFVMRVKSIKFTWSSTLPVDTHLSKRLGHDQVHVVDSGVDKLGEWQTHRMNVRDLFLDYFKKDKIETPVAIAILTDADGTDSDAVADYGTIKICKE